MLFLSGYMVRKLQLFVGFPIPNPTFFQPSARICRLRRAALIKSIYLVVLKRNAVAIVQFIDTVSDSSLDETRAYFLKLREFTTRIGPNGEILEAHWEISGLKVISSRISINGGSKSVGKLIQFLPQIVHHQLPGLKHAGQPDRRPVNRTPQNLLYQYKNIELGHL